MTRSCPRKPGHNDLKMRLQLNLTSQKESTTKNILEKKYQKFKYSPATTNFQANKTISFSRLFIWRAWDFWCQYKNLKRKKKNVIWCLWQFSARDMSTADVVSMTLCILDNFFVFCCFVLRIPIFCTIIIGVEEQYLEQIWQGWSKSQWRRHSHTHKKYCINNFQFQKRQFLRATTISLKNQRTGSFSKIGVSPFFLKPNEKIIHYTGTNVHFTKI